MFEITGFLYIVKNIYNAEQNLFPITKKKDNNMQYLINNNNKRIINQQEKTKTVNDEVLNTSSIELSINFACL